METETISILTSNPHDITIADAEDVAIRIRSFDSSWNVKVEGLERTGRGITFFQVLHVTLLGGAFAAGKILVEEVARRIADMGVDWARERFKRRPNQRPIYIAIHGPDGTVISLVIKNATDAPESRTEQDQALERDYKIRHQQSDEHGKGK